MARFLFAMLAGGLLLLPPRAVEAAAVYAYVDREGTAHFTNAPTKPYFRPLPGFGLPRGVSLTRGEYAQLINHIATEEGVDPALVRAIIQAESNFDQYAVSRRGARGLMQLMPNTAWRYAVANTFSPEENIRGGVRYLRYLQDLFAGKLPLALAAYNAGENVVLRHNGIPPYPETRQYVNRVLSFYRRPDQPAGRTGMNGALVPSIPRTKADQDVPVTSRVFRRVDADGTPFYTNVPPLVRSSPSAPR
jgi:soluble lytic murein transglycosylase